MNHTLRGWHLEPDLCRARNVYTGRRTHILKGCTDCHAAGRSGEDVWDASICDRETWDALPEIWGDQLTGDPLCDECYERREFLRERGLYEVRTYNAEPDLLRDAEHHAYWEDGSPVTAAELATLEDRDVLAAVLTREGLGVSK